MDFPKSPELIAKLVRIGSHANSLIMDFFSGSASTADAVINVNAEDGGNRRFIMIQLPEHVAPDSAAAKAGYSTISDIAKERIRLVGKHVLRGDSHDGWNHDIGFRVLKVDTSNMVDVYYLPEVVKQTDLVGHADNIKPDRTPEDLLFQVLVDWGVDLSLPISHETVLKKRYSP